MLAVLSPGTWTDLRCAMLALLAVVLPVKLATCQPNDVAASGSAVSADIIAAAKDSCRDVRNSIRLSPDRSILCFDGSIRADLDVGIFRDLRQGGLFVMRSDGGWGHIAIALSKILRDKDATVILHGHCLSACAEYVLIATSRTIVTKGTIVAWHEVVTQDDRPLHST
jgi:hypothetical protein